MRRVLLACVLAAMVGGWACPLPAGEIDEGRGRLDLVTLPLRPAMEWPLTAFGATMFWAGWEGLYLPARIADLVVFPPSYYWDYDTADYWPLRQPLSFQQPAAQALPAMHRRLKDSEQPRLLPESLRPEIQR